jgi:hypothetical protein
MVLALEDFVEAISFGVTCNPRRRAPHQSGARASVAVGVSVGRRL